MYNCKILPVLAAVFAVTAGVAKAEQQIIRSDIYVAGAAAGYWLIQGAAQNPPDYTGPGKWVYCVDIGPALGAAGGDALHPQYYVVEVGQGGWGWDDGSGRNPCLQVKRTVALTPPPPPAPISPDPGAAAPGATGTAVPGSRGSGSGAGPADDSGSLFDDLRQSGR